MDQHHLDQPLAAEIGLDWADAHHDVSLLPAGSEAMERRRIPHTPEGLRDWTVELRQRLLDVGSVALTLYTWFINSSSSMTTIRSGPCSPKRWSRKP